MRVTCESSVECSFNFTVDALGKIQVAVYCVQLSSVSIVLLKKCDENCLVRSVYPKLYG
jgi:hypothetical protein